MINYFFYGYSGNQHQAGNWPSFPDGQDADKTFEIIARTLKVSRKTAFSGDTFEVHQAWDKKQILDTLLNASEQIREVHIVAHGDSTRLSLSYQYKGLPYLREIAQKANQTARNHSSEQGALHGYLLDPAINLNYFHKYYSGSISTPGGSTGVPPNYERNATLNKLRNKVSGSEWQIWACYTANPQDVNYFSGVGDPTIDSYLERYNFGRTDWPCIAKELANELNVKVTGAYGGRGVAYYYAKKMSRIQRGGADVSWNQPPMWGWIQPDCKWVSFDTDGSQMNKPLIFGKQRDASELPEGEPPWWLREKYWQGAALGGGS